ncbi:hypothetical protein VTL71DRAFT_6753, partial [Oculimacula yallundae]
MDTLYIQPHVFPCFSGQYDNNPIAKLAGHLRIINPGDLRRVKKLAISLEAELVMENLHESLLAILRIFSGVEDVSLVVKEFREGTESRQDARLVEPIEVESAISSYHRRIHILLRGQKLELRLYPIDTVAQVNNRIEWVKALWRKNKGDPDVKVMPRIHAKVLVSASLKTELDRARRMYNLALKNYEIRMEALREARMRENLAAAGCCTQDVVLDEEIDPDEDMHCTEVITSNEDFDAGWSSQDFKDITWTNEDIRMVEQGDLEEEFETGWTAVDLMMDDEISQMC